MVTEAQKKATAKYNKENYDRMELLVPKGKRTTIDERAKVLGMTRNSYISKLIEQDMKIDPSKLDEPIISMIENHPEVISLIKYLQTLSDEEIHRIATEFQAFAKKLEAK